jgi:hypothetical protein
MKIIFLDIDGVLNSQLWYVKTKGSRKRDDLDTEAIGFLNNLIEKTGAKVVVSSTWRHSYTEDQLQDILDRNGFKGEVIGTTLDLRRGTHGDCILRGNEILAWMKDHPAELGCAYYDYKDYVILDDDSDMLFWQKDNFVQTDPYVGITPRIVFKARKILNRDDQLGSE